MKPLKIVTFGAVASLCLALVAPTEAAQQTIIGHSPSPILDRAGNVTLLFVDKDERLCLGRQVPPEGGFRSWKIGLAGRAVSFPRLKEDRAGSLHAVWVEDDSNSSDIFLGDLKGNGISERRVVSTTSGINFSPDLDFDPANTAWISWINHSGSSYKIYVREMGRNRIWLVSPPSLLSASQVLILTNGRLGTWVFWTGRDSGRDEVFAVRFDGINWSKPARLNQDHTVPHLFMDAALAPDGRPRLVWSAYDGEDYELYASSWTGSSWSREEKLTKSRASNAFPSLAFIGNGRPIVVWRQSHGTENALCARLQEAGVWGPEIQLINAPENGIEEPRIAVNNGRMVVFWKSGDSIRCENLTYEQLILKKPGEHFFSRISKASSEFTDENKYIGFGDSITYGEINHEAAPEKGYIPRLETLLKLNFGPSEMINEGFPGEQTAEGLARIGDILAKHSARYLLLMEGTNDIIHVVVSTDTTAFNIEQMIRKCRDFGTLPILASIPPRTDRFWTNKLFRDKIYALNEKINEIRLSQKIPFVDIFNTFLNYPASDGGWQSLISDGVHPNETGYEIMAHAWWNAIQDLPFPPSEVSVQRLTERSLFFSRKINSLTWQHSLKISDPFLLRSYRIYRRDTTDVAAGYELLAQIPYSGFYTLQKFRDVGIQETHSYRYVISVLRLDLVEGAPSDPAQDIGSANSANLVRLLKRPSVPH